MKLNNRNKRIKVVATLYIIAIVLVILGWAYIKNIRTPICPIYNLTGMSCPTCGVTRMLTEIVTTFNIYQAFRYNPVMFIVLPFMSVLIVIQTINYIRFGKFTKHYDKILTAVAITVITFGILRNVPMLYWLLPTKI